MRSLKSIKGTECLEFSPDGTVADAVEFRPDGTVAGLAGFRPDGTTAILVEPCLFRLEGQADSIFPFRVHDRGKITSSQSIFCDAKCIFCESLQRGATTQASFYSNLITKLCVVI